MFFEPDPKARTSDLVARMRVLTVDDHPTSTRMVRLTLERTAGVEVMELNQPTRALEVAGEFRPHLIILDIDMPGIDGTTLWRQLRALPEHEHTPVVFLTSRFTTEEAEAHTARSRGGNTRVLAKPVSMGQLTECITSLLASQPRSP